MNNLLCLPRWKKTVLWYEALRRYGFDHANSAWQNPDSIQVRAEAAWLILRTPPCDRQIGLPAEKSPGLWKPVRTLDGPCSVFEVPLSVFPQGDAVQDEPASALLEATLHWALNTVAGRLPEDWRPPPKETVENWLLASGMTIQAASHLRQGKLICTSDQLTLQFSLVPSIPMHLSEVRRAWLVQWVNQAQHVWRLVRFRRDTPSPNAAILAEVDLTGVPPPLARPMTLTGLESLRWVVSSLVETAEFLAAPVSSEALELRI